MSKSTGLTLNLFHQYDHHNRNRKNTARDRNNCPTLQGLFCVKLVNLISDLTLACTNAVDMPGTSAQEPSAAHQSAYYQVVTIAGFLSFTLPSKDEHKEVIFLVITLLTSAYTSNLTAL